MTIRLEERGPGGIYADADWNGPRGEERYTLFVGLKADGAPEEEIDVDASSEDHARRIGEAAIERDYAEGVVIYDIVLRPRGIWYL